MLPRHTVTAPWLWKLLQRLLAGASIKASVESLAPPFALETFYHLLERLRRRLPDLRSRLCREQKAPDSSQSDPLLQTAEHLQLLLANTSGVLNLFQLRFQHPLLG